MNQSSTPSFESQAIRNADQMIARRQDTPDERLLARTVLRSQALVLPPKLHPRALTEEGSDDALDPLQQAVVDAQQELLAEYRDELATQRLVELVRSWHGARHHLAELTAEDLGRLREDQRAQLGAVHREQAKDGPLFTRLLEYVYAETLRRSGAFRQVLMTNEATDVLAHADLLVEVDVAPVRAGGPPRTAWGSIDLTTAESDEVYRSKRDRLDRIPKSFPFYSSAQRPVGDMQKVGGMARSVQFVDFFVLKTMLQLLQSEALGAPISTRPEVWVRRGDTWSLGGRRSPVEPDETWTNPQPALSDAKFTELLQRAFELGERERVRDAKRYPLPPPHPDVAAAWPSSAAQLSNRVQQTVRHPGSPNHAAHVSASRASAP